MFSTAQALLFLIVTQVGPPPDGPEKPGNDNKQYANELRYALHGTDTKLPALQMHGAQAKECVQFGPSGLTISLPLGFPGERPPTGVSTLCGLAGDFEITAAFEVLKEPAAADAGETGTRLTLAILLATPQLNKVTFSRKLRPSGPEFVTWSSLWNAAAGKNQPHGNLFPAEVRSGKLRLVRAGAELSHYLAPGDSDQFELLSQESFPRDDVKEIQLTCATAGHKAALEVRWTDFRVRADGLNRRSAPAGQDPDERATAPFPAPSLVAAKSNYARELQLPLTGPTAGLDFLGPEADQCIRFEPPGMLISLPSGRDKERPPTGVTSTFGVRGDFEITVGFRVLKEAEAKDAGEKGSNLWLNIALDSAEKNVARVSRKLMPTGSPVRMVTYSSIWDATAGAQKARGQVHQLRPKGGRLRLVRNGDVLSYFVAEGDQDEFQLLRQEEFPKEDVKEIQFYATTGGSKSAVEVLFKDLLVRADGLLAEPAPRKSRVWLITGLLVGFGLSLVVAALLYVRFSRDGSRPVPARGA
jgi:Protein of unknown function (DUF1583)